MLGIYRRGICPWATSACRIFALWLRVWESTNYNSHNALHLASYRVSQMVDNWKAGERGKQNKTKHRPLIPDPVSTNPIEEESWGSSPQLLWPCQISHAKPFRGTIARAICFLLVEPPLYAFTSGVWPPPVQSPSFQLLGCRNVTSSLRSPSLGL